ncbi:hypothetical protein ACFWZW_03515 [Microbacterium enclense]|uniref:hypothetical protein n=1 Tax=Microbacterium enclense TaxID=993073 RepID=UPI0036DF1501
MLATNKQIELARKLEIRLRLLDARNDARRMAEFRRMTKAEISQHIRMLNEHTGFKSSTSPSTPAQRTFLETLQKELHGAVDPRNDRLTYAEADKEIRYWREVRRESTQREVDSLAPVIDITTRRSV